MKTLLLLFMTLSVGAYAQNHLPTASGARGLATGQVRTTAQDVQSIFGNQAGLAFAENAAVTAFGVNRFALADINQFSAGAAIPTASGTYGLALHYFGFDAYNEQKIGLAYARKLAKNLSIGGQIDYLNVSIPEYGNRGTLTFELGLQATITKKWLLATHIFSPVAVQWNNQNTVPTALAIGAQYRPSSKIRILMEVEKDIEMPARYKAGFDYQLVEVLSLRGGFATFPVENSFGIGLHLQSITIDLATVFHQILGASSGVSVSYDF